MTQRHSDATRWWATAAGEVWWCTRPGCQTPHGRRGLCGCGSSDMPSGRAQRPLRQAHSHKGQPHKTCRQYATRRQCRKCTDGSQNARLTASRTLATNNTSVSRPGPPVRAVGSDTEDTARRASPKQRPSRGRHRRPAAAARGRARRNERAAGPCTSDAALLSNGSRRGGHPPLATRPAHPPRHAPKPKAIEQKKKKNKWHRRVGAGGPTPRRLEKKYTLGRHPHRTTRPPRPPAARRGRGPRGRPTASGETAAAATDGPRRHATRRTDAPPYLPRQHADAAPSPTAGPT